MFSFNFQHITIITKFPFFVSGNPPFFNENKKGSDPLYSQVVGVCVCGAGKGGVTLGNILSVQVHSFFFSLHDTFGLTSALRSSIQPKPAQPSLNQLGLFFLEELNRAQPTKVRYTAQRSRAYLCLRQPVFFFRRQFLIFI